MLRPADHKIEVPAMGASSFGRTCSGAQGREQHEYLLDRYHTEVPVTGHCRRPKKEGGAVLVAPPSPGDQLWANIKIRRPWCGIRYNCPYLLAPLHRG